MNDDTPITPEQPVSTIRDEDQFQDAITAAKIRSGKSDDHDSFASLESEIHTALARQDSETALALVTR